MNKQEKIKEILRLAKELEKDNYKDPTDLASSMESIVVIINTAEEDGKGMDMNSMISGSSLSIAFVLEQIFNKQPGNSFMLKSAAIGTVAEYLTRKYPHLKTWLDQIVNEEIQAVTPPCDCEHCMARKATISKNKN